VTKKIHHRGTEDTKNRKETEDRRQKTEDRIRNTEYGIRNTEPRTPNPEPRTPNGERREGRIMRFLSAEGAKFLSPGRRFCEALG
jgi:flagella basal body P-ring formation protein FlgA